MSRNKSFDFRERLEAIHSGSKTKKYLFKELHILQSAFVIRISKHLKLLLPKIRTGGFLLPHS